MKIQFLHGLDAWAWRLVKRLLASRKGESSFDAIEAKLWLRQEFEIEVDWHPLASILDELEREGRAEKAGCNADGFVSYRIL